MKKMQILGNLTKDAEKFKTKDEKDYVRFTVACHDFKSGAEKTDFVDVFSFDKYTVENAESRLVKGRKVLVMGDMDHNLRVKDGKAWINFRVVADWIDYPNGFAKKDDGEMPSAQVQEQSYTAVSKTVKTVETPPEAPSIPDDNDLPF